MKLLAVLALLSLSFVVSAGAEPWRPAEGHTQVRLWPGVAPGERAARDRESFGPVTNGRPIAGRTWTYVANVSRPTLTVYAPAGGNTGAAVVVFPGGGYNVLAIDLEGTEICDWLTSRGITCVLLKYRVPNSGPHWDESCRCQTTPSNPAALQDAQRAIGLVRLHAREWHVDPHRVGVIGFSAGGHLVANISTHFAERAYSSIDAADRESCRPDFAIALYPGHLWTYDAAMSLNPDIRVPHDAPPTFLLHAENDPTDQVYHSLVYYNALKEAGVPVEMHLYAEGGHAFGLRRTEQPITQWPALVETWMQTIGMLPHG